MKNKFKISTLRNLAFVWLTGKDKINLFGKEFSLPIKNYHTLPSFLHRAKQSLILKELGEEKLLSMTMGEIFNYEI